MAKCGQTVKSYTTNKQSFACSPVDWSAASMVLGSNPEHTIYAIFHKLIDTTVCRRIVVVTNIENKRRMVQMKKS